jgi:hypothetical protein
MLNFNTIAYYRLEFLSYKDWYNFYMYYSFKYFPFEIDSLNINVLANVVHNRTIKGMYCNYFQM